MPYLLTTKEATYRERIRSDLENRADGGDNVRLQSGNARACPQEDNKRARSVIFRISALRRTQRDGVSRSVLFVGKRNIRRSRHSRCSRALFLQARAAYRSPVRNRGCFRYRTHYDFRLTEIKN